MRSQQSAVFLRSRLPDKSLKVFNTLAIHANKSISTERYCLLNPVLLQLYDKCLKNASNLLHSPFYSSSRVSNIYFGNRLLKLITKCDS